MDPRLQQLWAPWRLAYVASPKPPTAEEACFICAGLADHQDRRNLIALRTDFSVVVLNRFPYNAGHLLIAPRRHVARLDELSTDETLDNQQTLARMTGILDALMKPEGYNIGLNLGKSAGAGLPGHLHWHLVPRWNGDTNFMPVIHEVKVIVQSLDALWELVTERVGCVEASRPGRS
jgi:ATP adenylyltransferase